MMLMLLAQRDSGNELLYVIAVLILAAGGAIFEKLKQKMAGGPPSSQPLPRPRLPMDEEAQRELPTPRPVPPRVPQPMRPRPRPAPPAPARAAGPRPVPPRSQPAPPKRVAPAVAPASTPIPVSEAARGGVRVVQAVTEVGARSGQAVHSPGGRATDVVQIALLRGMRPDELRRAIVLREVLGPPLALREGTM